MAPDYSPIDHPRVPELLDAVEKAGNILLVSHIRPDGDAAGSSGGLYHILSDAGKKVHVALADPVPATFRYALAKADLRSFDNLEDSYDLVIMLDTGVMDRIGAPYALNRLGPIATIDHHITNDGEGIAVVFPTASSTCELVVRIFGHHYDISLPSAEALLLGLSTDTRTFQNRNVTSETHKVAAALIDIGADRNVLMTRLEESRTLNDLKILTDGLSMASYDIDSGLAWVAYDQSYFKKTETMPGRLWVSGIFNVLLMPKEIDISISAVEMKPGVTQIEFRSKSGDVSVIAKNLGGGGHLLASGCCMQCDPHEALKIVLASSDLPRLNGSQPSNKDRALHQSDPTSSDDKSLSNNRRVAAG